MFDDPQAGVRFERYFDGATALLGLATRVDPFRLNCLGLLVTPGRKSVEPMAASMRLVQPRRRISHCCTALGSRVRATMRLCKRCVILCCC
jgi:SRSO17 transposase